MRCTGQCAFDPGPVGTSVGMICGGFATALAALAAYMAATKRPQSRQEESKQPEG
jgi:hypothetical protein